MFKEVININIKDLNAINISRQDIIKLIETIIFILLDMDIIKCGNKKDELLTLLKLSIQILDSSIDLTEMINVPEIINCTYWCC